MSAKKATDTVKKTAPAKAAETAAALVKDAAEKAEPAKTAPVKEAVKEDKAPAKKAAAPKKAAAKTTTTKTAKTVKEAASQNVYIQFAGKEVKTEDLVEQVKAAWAAEGHRASSIKSLELYVKPEDMAVYYVINGKVNGKLDL